MVETSCAVADGKTGRNTGTRHADEVIVVHARGGTKPGTRRASSFCRQIPSFSRTPASCRHARRWAPYAGFVTCCTRFVVALLVRTLYEQAMQGEAEHAWEVPEGTPMLNMDPITLRTALAQLEQATRDHVLWQENLLRAIVCSLPFNASEMVADAHLENAGLAVGIMSEHPPSCGDSRSSRRSAGARASALGGRAAAARGGGALRPSPVGSLRICSRGWASYASSWTCCGTSWPTRCGTAMR